MAKDKAIEALLDALRQALASGSEQPLFRSGKQPGLFPGKSGANAEAAARAVREQLIEVVRVESKGKSQIEWVRITPTGVDFLHDHESPLRVLTDLQETLRTSQDALPAWLQQMQTELQQLSHRLTGEAERWSQQLEALSQRVHEALHRLEVAGPNLSNGMTTLVPWAKEALAYLDRRRTAANGPCPLSELFAALTEAHNDLSLTDFHNGLRRLQDGRVVRLLPFTEAADKLPEPEHALLDGGAVLYYVTK